MTATIREYNFDLLPLFTNIRFRDIFEEFMGYLNLAAICQPFV
jgi:hypothetical protein